MRLLTPLLFLAACASTPAALPTAPDAALTARVDAALDAAIREQRIVGGVVLVARDGALVYHRAVGLADRESQRPMREDAIFRLASITKPLVAATTLLLADRGVLRLDDPITKHLPDFTPALADGSTPTITIRQLLTHTSGITYGFLEPADGPYHAAGVSDGLDAPGRTWPDNQRRLVGVPLVSAPGTRFGYSLSLDVLGAALARTTATSLPALLERTITGPLAMRDTGFTVTDRDRLATPYTNQPSGPPDAMTDTTVAPFGASGVAFAPSRILDPSSYPSGGAGAAGTARDILRFLEAVRTNTIGFAAATHAAALADQLGTADHSEVGPHMGFSFLGAVALPGAAAPTGTVTWGGAYGHTWWIDPTNKLSVVILTNTAFEGMVGPLVSDVRAAIY